LVIFVYYSAPFESSGVLCGRRTEGISHTRSTNQHEHHRLLRSVDLPEHQTKGKDRRGRKALFLRHSGRLQCMEQSTRSANYEVRKVRHPHTSGVHYQAVSNSLPHWNGW